MTSADFSRQALLHNCKCSIAFVMSVRPPRVLARSFIPYICHIYCKQFRVVIGLRLVRQPYPCLQPDMISVRQTGISPPASFRFAVTGNTLALGYLLPTTGRIADLHRRTCARRAHKRTAFCSFYRPLLFSPYSYTP